MVFGIPEAEGLRCAYHGWLFDETGRCLERPDRRTPEARQGDAMRVRDWREHGRLDVIAHLLFRSGGVDATVLADVLEILPHDLDEAVDLFLQVDWVCERKPVERSNGLGQPRSVRLAS